MAEQLRIDQFRRDCPAIDPIEGALVAGRTIVNCPGHQLFARARLAEDQDGGIGAGDQFDAFHDRAEPRFDPHDGIAQRFASQPRQQRSFVGLGGLAQGGHLPQTQVVIQGRGEWFQEQLRQSDMLLVEAATSRRQENQQAAMPRRITERPGERVAFRPAKNQRDQFLRDTRIAPAMRHSFLPAPCQQRL